MNLKNSVLHRQGAEIAKVRKENQSATRTAPVFHRHPQGEWPSTTHLLFPLRSLRLRAFAVRFSGAMPLLARARQRDAEDRATSRFAAHRQMAAVLPDNAVGER